MGTVTFIVGYCGSGKSHLADQMEQTLGVKKFDEGFLDDSNQHTELIQALRSDMDCIVVEINYCLEERRQSIIEELERAVPGVRIKWEYFEADIETANENCRKRTNRDPLGHVNINKHIGSRYKIPAGVALRKIYRVP